MEKWRNYNLSFSGLSLGNHTFDFELGQAFFDLFAFEQEFENPVIKVDIDFIKKENMLQLGVKLKGTLELACDLTNEIYTQKIKRKETIVVKFGDTFDDSDDEIWTIPWGEHKINLAQLFYEMVMIAIPIKKIHPDVLSGQSNSEMLELLHNFEISDSETDATNQEEEKEEIDPRWEKLKNFRSEDKN